MYAIGFESTWVPITVLVATIAALAIGVVAARRAESRSADALLGIAGAVLAGLLLLQALLFVLVLLAGWGELR